jgi:hypothetical protein
MEALLIIAVIAAGVALLLRPTPQAPIVYIPVERLSRRTMDWAACRY